MSGERGRGCTVLALLKPVLPDWTSNLGSGLLVFALDCKHGVSLVESELPSVSVEKVSIRSGLQSKYSKT